MKYAVTITKGDSRKILEICDTKDEAMEKGVEHKKRFSMDSGILSCISADFDDYGNIIDGNYRLHYSWL